MYRTVQNLTRDELDELKETYFWQLMDENPEILGDITSAAEIPDNVIFEHYDGICFVDDDFFCNC